MLSGLHRCHCQRIRWRKHISRRRSSPVNFGDDSLLKAIVKTTNWPLIICCKIGGHNDHQHSSLSLKIWENVSRVFFSLNNTRNTENARTFSNKLPTRHTMSRPPAMRELSQSQWAPSSDLRWFMESTFLDSIMNVQSSNCQSFLKESKRAQEESAIESTTSII